MSLYKLDYSELVTALQNNEQGKANRLLKQLLHRLEIYLTVVMDASEADSKEAVQRAFFNAYPKIMAGEISNKKYIYKYFLTACRREYVRMYKEEDRYTSDFEDDPDTIQTPSNQIEKLLDKDRQRVLKECLQQLPEQSRNYITYIMNHPEATTKSLSERFELTESNVRVKKSRIMNDLSHCVKRKMEE